MSKWNLERFTGGRRAIELEEGATKGATVGSNLFYNGVLVRWEDIYNGGSVTPVTPGTAITNWSLIADIPANIVALSGLAGTGLVVRTGDTTYALREITSIDGSVTITNPDGVGGDIDLSAAVAAEGGIGISVGTYLSTAAVIPVATEATSIADSGYELTGEWYLWCYPSGSIEIDVWKDVFGVIPTVADSICGGSEPVVVANTFATGTFTGPITIARTDTLLAHVNSNTGVQWFKLLLIGDKI